MRKQIRFLQQPLLTVCLVMAGCSTLEVRDVYRLTGQEHTFVSHKSDALELQLGLNPDTRFYSFGMLGVPIIPTRIEALDPTEVGLLIRLTFREDRDFSLEPSPCLISEKSRHCPHNVEVSAVALYQDDGSMYADKQKRWNKISSFYNTGTPILRVFTTPESAIRISRSLIYQHYGYTGDQKWGYLRVDIKYTYKCGDGCPKQLGVDTKNLILINNESALTDTYGFEKARESHYRFTTIVQ